MKVWFSFDRNREIEYEWISSQLSVNHVNAELRITHFFQIMIHRAIIHLRVFPTTSSPALQQSWYKHHKASSPISNIFKSSPSPLPVLMPAPSHINSSTIGSTHPLVFFFTSSREKIDNTRVSRSARPGDKRRGSREPRASNKKPWLFFSLQRSGRLSPHTHTHTRPRTRWINDESRGQREREREILARDSPKGGKECTLAPTVTPRCVCGLRGSSKVHITGAPGRAGAKE